MSRSSVYIRMICGARWPTPSDYQKVPCPVLVIAAEKVSLKGVVTAHNHIQYLILFVPG
jgi:hypothetical protein